MNMIGAVKHVDKALEAGVDIICAQGGEGGGHTGPRETSGLMAVSDKPVSWGEGSGFRPMIYRVFIHIYSGNLIPSTPFSPHGSVEDLPEKWKETTSDTVTLFSLNHEYGRRDIGIHTHPR